jgi:hypothetical protein
LVLLAGTGLVLLALLLLLVLLRAGLLLLLLLRLLLLVLLLLVLLGALVLILGHENAPLRVMDDRSRRCRSNSRKIKRRCANLVPPSVAFSAQTIRPLQALRAPESKEGPRAERRITS